MQNGFTPSDAAKRLKELAASFANAPTESIVVYRVTPGVAAQIAADLQAVAAVVEAIPIPAPSNGGGGSLAG